MAENRLRTADFGNCPSFRWDQFRGVKQNPLNFNFIEGHQSFAFGHRVILFGGRNNVTAGGNRYILPVLDTVQRNWSGLSAPRSISKRTEHVAFAKADIVYILGGFLEGERVQDNFTFQSSYDVLARTSSEVKVHGINPFPREAATGGYVERLDVFVMFGGKAAGGDLSNEIFCLRADSMEWYTPPTRGIKPSPRVGASSCVGNKSVYIYGGHGGFGNLYLGGLFVLKETSGLWTWSCVYDPVERGMPPRQRSAMAYFQGRVLIYGGRNANGRSLDFHLYLAADDSVNYIADADRPGQNKFLRYGGRPLALSGHSIVRIGPTLYITGGTSLHNDFMTIAADAGETGVLHNINLSRMEELLPAQSPYVVVPESNKHMDGSLATQMRRELGRIRFDNPPTSGTVYVVANDWVDRLKVFVRAQSTVVRDPGPVDNSPLFEPHMCYQREHSYFANVYLVAAEDWHTLMDWFGGNTLCTTNFLFLTSLQVDQP